MYCTMQAIRFQCIVKTTEILSAHRWRKRDKTGRVVTFRKKDGKIRFMYPREAPYERF